MSVQFPVFVEVGGEKVRVGTATQVSDGFMLKLGELSIGGQPLAPSRPAATGGASGGEVFPNYGRSKGMPIRGASMQDLEFYANGARRSLSDPGKARFHEKERALLALIEAEIARQGGGSAERDDAEPPPPGDEDAPF